MISFDTFTTEDLRSFRTNIANIDGDVKIRDQWVNAADGEIAKREREDAERLAAFKARVGFLRRGHKAHDPFGESWTVWMVFPPYMSDAEVLERCGWTEFSTGVDYSPSGKVFGWRPRIRRTSTRVLVTQHRGRDV